MVGQTISHYLIEQELGRGGMGVVYRATDLRLDRPVAIKLLHASTLDSTSERARFHREAKAAAALSHPHIASIHEIDETEVIGATDHDKVPFIVMEFIDGSPLDALIEKGPLPLRKAVQIAHQVASALEAAHTHQIVHRDIKPQNIMVTTGDEAKILDFGLVQTDASTRLTQEGSTLGTIAYMSPEQARGEVVDRRTDLWSLGVTLYEMIAGSHPFPGDYEQARLYNVLNTDPEPLTAIRTGVPQELERIVDKLMSKDRELRYQTALDLMADLKAVDLGSGVERRAASAARGDSGIHVSAAPVPASDTKARGRGMQVVLWIATLIIAAFGGYKLGLWGTEVESPVIYATLDVLEGDDPPIALAVSSDAKLLAFSDLNTVRVRDLETGNTWSYRGSEDILRMIFSPDDQWLLMERPGAILRAPSDGGRVMELTRVDATFPHSYLNEQNELIYESGGRIYSLPLGGGEPTEAIQMDSVSFYNDPVESPDGSSLVIAISGDTWLFDKASGQKKSLLSESTLQFPMFVNEKLILHGSGRGVFLTPVDLKNSEVLDAAFTLSETVMPRSVALSKQGHLFYAHQVNQITGGFAQQRYFRHSWTGIETALAPAEALYGNFDIDPSGRRVAFELLEGNRGIGVSDLRSGVSTMVFTHVSAADPVWVADTDSVLYVVNQPNGTARVQISSSSGSGEPRLVTELEGRIVREPHVSADGQRAYLEVSDSDEDQIDIWTINLWTGETTSFLAGTGKQSAPVSSADGRAFAYEDWGRGGTIMLRTRDSIGAEWGPSVAVAEGRQPRWGPDSSTLYFVRNGNLFSIDASSISASDQFLAAQEVLKPTGRIRYYDVLPNDEGIVYTYAMAVRQIEGREDDGLVRIVFNWGQTVEDLRALPE